MPGCGCTLLHVAADGHATVLAAAAFRSHHNGAAFTEDGRLIVVAPIRASGAVRLVHIIDSAGEVQQSLVEAPDHDPRRWHASRRVIANSPDGHLWIGDVPRYVIELWSPRGGMVRQVRREAPWFTEWSGDPALGWENAMLSGIVQERRYLWTLT